MAVTIFQYLEQYLPAQCSGVFVEIGSDRYEGSTALLAHSAALHGTQLISVDHSNDAQRRLGAALPAVQWVQANGSTWAREFAQQKITIDCLSLDNFDYMYNTGDLEWHSGLQTQVETYRQMGIEMNNVNCQVEHLQQLLALYPRLSDHAVVIFDDTYQYQDCWIGKCGPGVVYLLANDWEILHHTKDCGVMLRRKTNNCADQA